ncbi:SusD-like starch-binding protein associating with outer membrane [Neolewinella xylanilytica]|uniref:SusD-like starch-binding protein associating with outer membrane n=1 Tax=Neolewinella xylanilytica TaxID=1514080 RepID=A0A2S6I0D6_9BACT|nr:SusD/RagB family nutrient-binding outer membrane lipoprotein [Neolewinella xylanilytica]PPK84310.1 SusD-like starch-binding protein associating with outer membrane [Neolewinella xylanilytica]
MNKLRYLLPLILLGCTQDFEEINTNGNAPSTVQNELLFRQVLYGYGDAMSYEGFVAGNLLSQHFAMIDFNLLDRHALSSPQEGGNPWDVLYVALRDNETVLQQSRNNPAAAVYEGPALVMKAYQAMRLTDIFGDVPYFEAVSGRTTGIVTPAYDRQEDIYLAEGGILDNLESAVAAIENYAGAIPLGGDIVFNGDLTAWRRFANSLRIKALLRISGRRDVGAELQSLYAAGDYIQSPEQNATFDFAAGPPNSFAFATARVGIFNVFLMSLTAEGIFAGLGDPRVSVLYRPAANTGEYRGIINGIDAATAIVPDDYARPGTIWRERTGDLDFNYMTAWETRLLLAEAAYRGLIEADARELYDAGVALAFAYWQTELPDDYLTSGPAAWDASRGLEQIITQKWIAGIGDAYEGWIEWRRTGYPALLPVAASLNDGRYPVRFPYPADEQALNFQNYRGAAEATDGNSVNVPVWWDVD